MTTSHADRLLAKIKAHDALIGIIGMGYVGLPLALAFVEKGFPVLGFDVDPDKVAKLNRGEGYIKHLDGGRIAAAVATGGFTATADFARLGEADAVLICVPTPLTPQREPDMTYVDAAAHQVRATLRPGQLIILESTTYPGTTDERLKSILESSTFASPIVRNGPQRRDERSKTDPSLAALAQDDGEAVILRRTAEGGPTKDLVVRSGEPVLSGETADAFLAGSAVLDLRTTHCRDARGQRRRRPHHRPQGGRLRDDPRPCAVGR